MALNAAQEKFCANIVAGKTQKEAYLDAFPDAKPSSAAVLANKLRKQPDIVARINDIKTTVRGETNMSIHKIVDELEEARQVAKKDNSPNLMMRASLLKAKLLGFVPDDELGAGLNVGSVEQLNIGTLKNLKDMLQNNE